MSLRRKRAAYDPASARRFCPADADGLQTVDGLVFVTDAMVGTVYEVFPMEFQRVQLGNQAVFDRNTRGRSWVILDLILPPGKFIPMESAGLLTKDGETFRVGRKRI